jgi:hypothetical protein
MIGQHAQHHDLVPPLRGLRGRAPGHPAQRDDLGEVRAAQRDHLRAEYKQSMDTR